MTILGVVLLSIGAGLLLSDVVPRWDYYHLTDLLGIGLVLLGLSL